MHSAGNSKATLCATLLVTTMFMNPAPLALADASNDPERIPPIEYVAPELRQSLLYIQEYYRGGKVVYSDSTLSALRNGAAQRMAGLKFLPSPEVKELFIPGSEGAPDVGVFIIGADPARKRPAILHMHGGGYIIGEAKNDVPRLQALAKRHDGVFITVDYRLAPETQFPGALEDNYAALKWVYQNAGSIGVDPGRISVMGESAGGGHAAMLALAARDRGEVPLQHQILIYPMLDDRTGSSREMPYWTGYGSWSAAANQYGWTSLLGVPAGNAVVPEGSVPARVEDLSGLPETFIGVGSVDLFAEENIEYARRLLRAGVPVQMSVVPGGFHGFQMSAPDTGLSREFESDIDAAISRAFR